MKKTLIALAALGVVGVASADATVYGRVDAGLKVSGGATNLVSGVTGTPRIGFKGSEDLGGGLAANFGIETGFNNVAEAATSIGDRGAYIGVSGGFGSVAIGSSLLTPTFFATAATDAMGLPNYGATESRMWGMAHERLRHDNAFQYSNNIMGVNFKLSYVPADDNSGKAKTDWSGVYGIDGLTLAVASHSAATGGKANTVAGFAYDFGAAKIAMNKLSGDNSQTGMGVSAPMGPVTLAAAVYKDNTGGTSSTNAKAVYALSKSTAVDIGIKAPKGSDSETYIGLSHSF
jgi:predicted porin